MRYIKVLIGRNLPALNGGVVVLPCRSAPVKR